MNNSEFNYKESTSIQSYHSFNQCVIWVILGQEKYIHSMFLIPRQKIPKNYLDVHVKYGHLPLKTILCHSAIQNLSFEFLLC